jgi:hypothetical protein
VDLTALVNENLSFEANQSSYNSCTLFNRFLNKVFIHFPTSWILFNKLGKRGALTIMPILTNSIFK